MLTDDEVATIKGMIARGDKQQDIAVYLSITSGRTVNVARVSEVVKKNRARWARVPPAGSLPEPGPYRAVPVRVYDEDKARRKALEMTAARLRLFLTEIEELIAGRHDDGEAQAGRCAGIGPLHSGSGGGADPGSQ